MDALGGAEPFLHGIHVCEVCSAEGCVAPLASGRILSRILGILDIMAIADAAGRQVEQPLDHGLGPRVEEAGPDAVMLRVLQQASGSRQ